MFCCTCDAKEKSLIGAMSGHASWVLSIEVSPDGLAVATGSSNRTVRLWDINMRTSVQTMSNHSDHGRVGRESGQGV